MSLKAGAASVAMIAAAVLVTAAPPLWAQQVPPRVLVVGPMVKIDGRLFIEGLWEGLHEDSKPGDSDLSQIRLDVKNVVSEEAAKAAIGPAIDTGGDRRDDQHTHCLLPGGGCGRLEVRGLERGSGRQSDGCRER